MPNDKAKKILVVDDDPDIIDAVKTLLEAKGYQVADAMSGEKGFEKAKVFKPNLILLDVMMKTDSEGLETAMSLKNDATTKNMPVIIMTGIRKAMYLPFSFEPNDEWPNVRAVLEKPVKPEELLKHIEKILSGAQSQMSPL